MRNEGELMKVLAQGREQARAVAVKTITEVKEIVGYLVP